MTHGHTRTEVIDRTMVRQRRTSLGAFLTLMVALVGCGFHAKAAPTSTVKKPVLSVVGFWANDVSTPLTALYTHPHAIFEFSPFWYSVTASGSLKSHVNATILAQITKAHIPVMPLVNDATGTQAFLPSKTTRTAAARAIADMVGTMHFQGVNIDFEPSHTHLRTELTAFMVELRDFLPHTDRITMDVVPHSGGAYQYHKLGPEINQFILMSYDEHAAGSLAGPVAAMPWVNNIVVRELKKVPASKLDLGIPVYGYTWPTGSTHAVTIPYNAVTPTMMLHAKWSPRYQETYAHFAGHTSWWESLQGMSQKIALAKRDHLAGVALWHMGYTNRAVMQLLLHQIGRQP